MNYPGAIYIQSNISNKQCCCKDGLSAYKIAVNNGFIGTEEEWLDSLIGEQGPPGPSGTSCCQKIINAFPCCDDKSDSKKEIVVCPSPEYNPENSECILIRIHGVSVQNNTLIKIKINNIELKIIDSIGNYMKKQNFENDIPFLCYYDIDLGNLYYLNNSFKAA